MPDIISGGTGILNLYFISDLNNPTHPMSQLLNSPERFFREIDMTPAFEDIQAMMREMIYNHFQKTQNPGGKKWKSNTEVSQYFKIQRGLARIGGKRGGGSRAASFSDIMMASGNYFADLMSLSNTSHRFTPKAKGKKRIVIGSRLPQVVHEYDDPGKRVIQSNMRGWKGKVLPQRASLWWGPKEIYEAINIAQNHMLNYWGERLG